MGIIRGWQEMSDPHLLGLDPEEDGVGVDNKNRSAAPLLPLFQTWWFLCSILVLGSCNPGRRCDKSRGAYTAARGDNGSPRSRATVEHKQQFNTLYSVKVAAFQQLSTHVITPTTQRVTEGRVTVISRRELQQNELSHLPANAWQEFPDLKPIHDPLIQTDFDRISGN